MAYGGHETPQMALDRALREGIVQEGSRSTYFCNVCNKSLSSKNTIKSHLRSQKHLKEAAIDSRASDDLLVDFGRRETAEQKNPGESYYCKICDKYLKTRNTMKAHLLTKTHMNKLQNSTRFDSQPEIPRAENVKLQSKPPRDPAYELNSTSTRSQQANGGKEKPQMALDRAITDRVVEEREGSSYFCNICQKSLKSKGTIKTHLTSQTHLKLQGSTHYDSDTRPETVQVRSKLSRVPAHKSTSSSTPVNQSPGSRNCYDSVDPVERAFAEGILSELGDGKADGGSYRCNICNQNLKVFAKLKAHLSSKKHNDKTSGSQTSGSQNAHYEQEDEEGEGECDEEDEEEAEEEEDETEEEEETEEEDETDEEVEKTEEEEYEDDDDLVSKSLRDGTLTASRTPTLPYWCNICMQPLKQYGRLASHLESKKHKAKVHAWGSQEPQGKDWKANLSFKYSDDYQIKGRVYVFNVLKERPGAAADTQNIKGTFSKLGYKVYIHEDFTKQKLYSKIEEIRKDSTLRNVGALILFILSHGKSLDTFVCSDEQTADLGEIKRCFTNSHCPSLKGKPKIIFANFCRGKDIEIYMCDEVVLKTEALVDTVIVYASNEGMKALRSKDKGTIFVQSLCEVLSSEECPKEFRRFCCCLHCAMLSKGGTTPMMTDHIFKEFTF